MKNNKMILNVTGIILTMVVMLMVILSVSLKANVHFFGFYSILKVLTYGATMFFLLSVFLDKKVKLAGASLLTLFFIAAIVPSIQRIKTFFIMLLGSYKGTEIPDFIMGYIKTPTGFIFVLQSLFAILLICLFVFSIYALFNEKKYSFKEISIMFLLMAVAFATIEIFENFYVYSDITKQLFNSSFSLYILIPRTPVMVFEYFIIVYLANDLKGAKDINLFYYIIFFAYTVAIGINTIISAGLSQANFIYTTFLIVSSILIYLYCLVLSVLIYKNK